MTDFYVSENGSGNNDGLSANNAFAGYSNLSAEFSALNIGPGDTVWVLDSLSLSTSDFTQGVSGTAGSPITFRGDYPSSPNGELLITNTFCTLLGDYLHFKNISVNQIDPTNYGFRFNSTRTDISFDNIFSHTANAVFYIVPIDGTSLTNFSCENSLFDGSAGAGGTGFANRTMDSVARCVVSVGGASFTLENFQFKKNTCREVRKEFIRFNSNNSTGVHFNMIDIIFEDNTFEEQSAHQDDGGDGAVPLVLNNGAQFRIQDDGSDITYGASTTFVLPGITTSDLGIVPGDKFWIQGVKVDSGPDINGIRTCLSYTAPDILEFDFDSSGGSYSHGSIVSHGSYGLQYLRNTIDRGYNASSQFGGFTVPTEQDRYGINRIADSNFWRTLDGKVGSGLSAGGPVMVYNKYLIIENCDSGWHTTDDIDGHAMDCDHGNDMLIIRNNYLHNVYGSQLSSKNGEGVLILRSSNVFVYGNVIESTRFGILVAGTVGLHNGIYVCNNLMMNCWDHGLSNFSPNVNDDIHFYNNITIGSGNYGLHDEEQTDRVFGSHNTFYNSSNGEYSQVGANYDNSNDLVSDPEVNSKDDYGPLTPSSPSNGSGYAWWLGTPIWDIADPKGFNGDRFRRGNVPRGVSDNRFLKGKIRTGSDTTKIRGKNISSSRR